MTAPPAPRWRHVVLGLLAILAIGCGSRVPTIAPLAAPTTPGPSPTAVPSPAPEPTPEAEPAAAPEPEPSLEPVAAAADDGCPPRGGPVERWIVQFHVFPDGIALGDEYACGEVVYVDDHPEAKLISVNIWDQADFIDRVEQDPNVRGYDRSELVQFIHPPSPEPSP